VNQKAAEESVQDFSDYVKANGFIPQKVFNCDENGLFWKKMPRRSYITEEGKALPGHKPMKDRLNLFATWKCKWGLQDQAITRVPLGESENA